MDPESAGVGVERYVDSPVFIDIILALFAFALGAGAFTKYQEPDRSWGVIVALGVGAVLCILSTFAQKRRTFAFDTMTRKLTWTSHGLRDRTGGTVDFKDVNITIEPSPTERYPTYRVMIGTPEGSWPLTTGYDSNQKRVEAKAVALRALIGQASDGLIDESIDRLQQSNNLIAAAKMISRQRGISEGQAFGEIVDAQKTKTPQP